MAVLIEETHKYEVDTREEADKLIKKATDESTGDVSYTRKFKKKETKEISDNWYEVWITQKYPDRKRY